MALLVDAHTGISDQAFDGNRKEVLARAREQLAWLVDNAVAKESGEHFRSRELSEAHPDIFFMTGVHPHDAGALSLGHQVYSELQELYSHPRCLAVGECGLDYFYKNSTRDEQIPVFEWHCREAEERGMPLVVHTRDAEEDTQAVLSSYVGAGMIHCFTASQALADFALAKDFYLCFSGIATFKNADDIRQVFLNTPLEKILIETDAPFLAPVPKRGQTNEPAFLKHTAEFLASLRKMSYEDFAAQIRENSEKFFRISQPALN